MLSHSSMIAVRSRRWRGRAGDRSAVYIAAVLGRVVAVLQSVVSHHGCNPQSIVCKYASAPPRLGLTVTLQGPPRTDRFFVAPERKRQILSLRDQTLEALDGDESVDPFEIGLERGCQIEVFAGSSVRRPDLKDHCDHHALLS